jgi:clan AA aspartic protease (TIGR02281 family)
MGPRSALAASFTCSWLFLIALLAVTSTTIAEEIRLGSHGGTFSVPVRLNDSITLDFVIDTGASNVVIPADVVSTLLRTGTLTERDFVDRTTYVMADGSKLPSLRFVLHDVRVGNQSARNVVASVSPARGEPLLGQSFLSRLRPWTLDYRRNALIVNEYAPSTQTAAINPPSVMLPQGAPLQGPVTPQLGYGGFGSFAHNESSGHYGFSWNEYDQPRADHAALQSCATNGCKVVFRVGPKLCGAIAVTDDGMVWGGATRPTRAAAELAAFQNCQKRTKVQCTVKGAECNR